MQVFHVKDARDKDLPDFPETALAMRGLISA